MQRGSDRQQQQSPAQRRVQLHVKVKQLTDLLLSDDIIEYESMSDESDRWTCVLCDEHAPIVFLPRYTASNGFSFHPHEPCDTANFPHAQGCPILLARQIHALLIEI